MTTADDLLAFIRAQLDQEEQTAHAATAGPWRVVDGKRNTWSTGSTGDAAVHGPGALGLDYVVPPDVDYGPALAPGDAHHITGHDPEHVLADIDAKRRQLDIIETMLEGDPATTGMYAHQLLLAHAAAYRHHPGYRPEWNTR